MSLSRRVLFIEDDVQIGEVVGEELEDLGCEVLWHQDGQDGWDRFQETDIDLVILDLRLPSLGGLEICERIREIDPYVPIVMLTAKAEKRDVVQGLELGADDYITKPFSNSELIARIQALFRRMATDRDHSEQTGSRNRLEFGPLRIDETAHTVTLEGQPVHLTAKEFDLLLQFARHPGRAFSRGELLSEVWGEEFDGYDHTVNTHINRLRSKIEPDPSEPIFLQTVWGVGYRFAEPGELEST
jgi:DNA-binding response OmpR family regulator